MCSWSSRRYGSVSARNACSSPSRARARVCSLTFASSHPLVVGLSSPVRKSRRIETRRSVLQAADASTTSPNEWRRSMGRIVMSGPQNVSLDGVVQDRNGEEGFRQGGWFREVGGKDLEPWAKVALDEALAAEAWLLGRRSYEYFEARWRPRSGALAERLTSMPKYVVSSTLVEPDWGSSTVLTGDVVSAVSRLKQELDGEIVLPGSHQL